MAHLPFSKEYLDYASFRKELPSTKLNVSNVKPIVSLISFGGAMRCRDKDFALGLRIIFGALRSFGCKLGWAEFFDRFKGFNNALDISDAVELLRDVCGAKRLFLVDVDEIVKILRDSVVTDSAVKVKTLVVQLGKLLGQDVRTDVLVSSLTAEFIANLVTPTSNRTIEYICVPPTNNGELDRVFKDMGATLLKDVRRKATCSLDEFSCRIISSIHLLAAGHPRTLQLLKQDHRDGRLLPC
jgi:hypothetical protein